MRKSVGINFKGPGVFNEKDADSWKQHWGARKIHTEPSPLLSPEVCGGKGRQTLSTPELCLVSGAIGDASIP